MSYHKEEQDIYYIPPNFLTSGRLFGGMIRVRNAIEACVLVLLTGLPIIRLPLSLTARIILLCLIPLPLGIFAVIGFDGDSLTEFALNWIKWLLAERCRQTMITDGSCGMRELKAWVLSTMITKDPYESALTTVIASASADPDNRADLISTCLEKQFVR